MSKTRNKPTRRAAKTALADINLSEVAHASVARAVKRGITNIDDLYISAERGARRRLTRAYNASTPRIIHNYTPAGRREVSRAANIQRAHNGMLHQHLVAAVLKRVVNSVASKRSDGDLLINGTLMVECKRTLRERRRQIFADGNKIGAVVLRAMDDSDEKRHCAEYTRKHGAKLVVPGGHPGAITLTDFVASLRHVAHEKVMA